MRAIINATGYKNGIASLLYNRPTPLLNIIDKPILFHVLDFLSSLNIKKYDLILSHLPHTIEEKIGNGRRWGIEITYHLARDTNYSIAFLQGITAQLNEEKVLIATGDGLPAIDSSYIKENLHNEYLWMYPHHRWSGWGILSGTLIKSASSFEPARRLFQLLPRNVKIVYTAPLINVESLFEFKASNFKILSGKIPSVHFPADAHPKADDVWTGSNSSIHPSTTLIPPVYIGRNSQIKANCRIGPQVVIEHNCIIDCQTIVSNTLVMDRSYIGEGLELNNCIVDRNLLINLSHKTEVSIRDDFILCELNSPHLGILPFKIFERFAASLLLILCLPLYLFFRARYRLIKTPSLSLPAKRHAAEWQTFNLLTFDMPVNNKSKSLAYHLRRLPELINIARGEIHFVGVPPRSTKEVSQLPPDWQRLYNNSKVGLINLVHLDQDCLGTENDDFAAEAFYTVQMGPWLDIKIFFRWLKQKASALLLTMRSTDAE